MIYIFLSFPLFILADQSFNKASIWSANGTNYISQEPSGDAIKITHKGKGSYAVTGSPSFLPVEVGDILQLSADIKISSMTSSSLTLSFAIFDKNKNAINWNLGKTTFSDIKDSFTTVITGEVLIAYGVEFISCRIIGDGPIDLEFKNMQMKLIKKIPIKIDKENYSISSDSISFTIDSKKYNFTVIDKRNGKEWIFDDTEYQQMVLLEASETNKDKITQLMMTFQINNFQCKAVYTLYSNEDNSIEFNFSCPSEMPMTTFSYPMQLQTVTKDDRLILPMNEGFSFKSDDFSHSITSTHTFGGHGLCMSFFGLYDDSEFDVKKSGLLYIVKSQNDFRLNIRKLNGLQTFRLNWNSERGTFGSYQRSIQLIFYDKCKHVEMCNRYRQYAIEQGRYLTFEEKQKKFPKIEFDKLIGSANIWFNTNYNKLVTVYQELQKIGFTHILASNDNSPSNINFMNDEMENILTSKYDIYQDVLNPDDYKWTRPNQTPKPFDVQAWPNDIAIKVDGSFKYGWSIPNVSNPDQMVSMGVLCDKQIISYAKDRINDECFNSNETIRKNLKCRFIDTTTASEWYECYHEKHEMTRSESREYRMKLLSLIHDFNMVCGSETGQDVAVPFCDYFEGMMSLGNFRVPNAGRNTDQIWGCEELDDLSCPAAQLRPVPENVVKFQMGHDYRLPLFELVYHGCLVSYWYWGDYNNKIPSLWVKRDMFNALYGVPPMYFLNNTSYDNANCTVDFNETLKQEGIFNETDSKSKVTTTIYHVKKLHKSKLNQDCLKQRLSTSYLIAEPVSRLTGYAQMIDFLILNNERTVQKSVFSNNVNVTCNFGNIDYKCDNGVVLPPFSVMIQNGGLSENSNSKGKGKNKAAVIAVSVIVVVVVIGLVAFAAFYFIRKKRNNKSENENDNVKEAENQENPNSSI